MACLVVGIALGCGGAAEVSHLTPGASGAGAVGGPVSAAGARAGNEPSAENGGLGASGGSDGEAEGGVGGDNAGGDGGAPSEPIWREDSQFIEIACFGFDAGFATFRANRAQLGAAQIALLADIQGVPGDDYDDNDHVIRCIAREINAAGQVRKLVAEDARLFSSESQLDRIAQQFVLGCEFRHWDIPGQSPALALPANPLCVSHVVIGDTGHTYYLDMPLPGRRYRVELTQSDGFGPTSDKCPGYPGLPKLELFGADTETPLAVGAPPKLPGPDPTCLFLEAEVDSPTLGRLVVTPTPSSPFEVGILFY